MPDKQEQQQKPAVKVPVRRQTGRKKAQTKTSARDVVVYVPTFKEVKESISKGTTYSLEEFRKLVGY